jgi:glycosyltransferase involved in cell wall biosynthesis
MSKGTSKGTSTSKGMSKGMIVPMIPYCPKDSPEPKGKNLGYAYRECMARLRDDDWALFLDHDITFLTPHWYPAFEAAITAQPDAGMIVPVHYDIVSGGQSSEGAPPSTAHIRMHAKHAGAVFDAYGQSLREITDVCRRRTVVGFGMCIKASVWREAGLDREEVWETREDVCPEIARYVSEGWTEGTKGVAANDTFIGRVIGASRRIYAMPGVYLYHSRMFWLDDDLHSKFSTDWSVQEALAGAAP